MTLFLTICYKELKTVLGFWVQSIKTEKCKLGQNRANNEYSPTQQIHFVYNNCVSYRQLKGLKTIKCYYK